MWSRIAELSLPLFPSTGALRWKEGLRQKASEVFLRQQEAAPNLRKLVYGSGRLKLWLHVHINVYFYENDLCLRIYSYMCDDWLLAKISSQPIIGQLVLPYCVSADTVSTKICQDRNAKDMLEDILKLKQFIHLRALTGLFLLHIMVRLLFKCDLFLHRPSEKLVCSKTCCRSRPAQANVCYKTANSPSNKRKQRIKPWFCSRACEYKWHGNIYLSLLASIDNHHFCWQLQRQMILRTRMRNWGGYFGSAALRTAKSSKPMLSTAPVSTPTPPTTGTWRRYRDY